MVLGAARPRGPGPSDLDATGGAAPAWHSEPDENPQTSHALVTPILDYVVLDDGRASKLVMNASGRMRPQAQLAQVLFKKLPDTVQPPLSTHIHLSGVATRLLAHTPPPWPPALALCFRS